MDTTHRMLRMQPSFYTLVSGILFTLLGLAFGLSANYGWTCSLGNWLMPEWALWLSTLVAFLMAFSAFRTLR